MKKTIMLGLVGAAPVLATFAEGEGATSTAVQTMLTDSQTALTGLITAGLPIVSALVVAGLTVWGGFKVVRLVMKAFGFGTR